VRRVGSLAAIFVLVLGVTACRGGDASVDRLEVLLALLPDGSLEVQESWIVQFGSPPSTSFVRELPSSHNDGLSSIQTSLDGRLLNEGSRGEYAHVRLGRAPRAEWTIASISDGVRRFQLRYRAAGTLAVSGGRLRFSWPVLARGHGWQVRQARVVLTAPAGASMFPGSGIDEPGWIVTPRPDGILAEKSDLTPRESVTARMELDRDPLSVAEPAWQFGEARAREFMPAFVTAAGFILIVGFGVLVMVRAMLPANAPDRGRAAARGLRASGVVLMLLGIALAAGVRYVLDSFGLWAMAIPVSVGLVGLMFLIAGRRNA
jgi:hypothetical protein